MTMKHLKEKETANVDIPNGQSSAEYAFTESYIKVPSIVFDCADKMSNVVVTTTSVTFTSADTSGYNFDIKVISQDEEDGLMTSPDGAVWKVSVDNSGVLTTDLV